MTSKSKSPRLVLAMLLGIGFGRPLHAQDAAATDKAVAEIQKLGGKVERDDKAPGKPVLIVNYATTQVEDSALVPVKGLTSLKKLTLNGAKITDAGLAHLKDLANLEKLYLVDTKITDAGLDHLKDLKKLKVLSLVGTQVTDAGLDKIKGMDGLTELFVFGSKVTEAGSKKLAEAKKSLKIDR